MLYDVIIIGAGPGGLTAGIYAKRAGLKTLLIQDKYSIGSQICNTYEVCNYPGFNNISGVDLYNNILEHSKSLELETFYEKVECIEAINDKIKIVKTKNNSFNTKTIILATGASPKKSGINREEEFFGQGISYCATCDGAFYKDKIVAVIGGGDVACEDAIFLSRIAKKVYLIVRKNFMRATKILQDEVAKIDNIEVKFNTKVVSINGNDKISGIEIISNLTNEISIINLDGIFVAIGIEPETNLLFDKVKMEDNYIIAGEDCMTSVDGIYAVGDVRKKQLRQVITACADGANAITSIQKYINENQW